MYEPENNNNNFSDSGSDANQGKGNSSFERDPYAGINDSPSSFTEGTDRVNGEYHYKNGYTQRIYSDAHYVPADENTVPPRYYTPPEKPVKEPKPPKPKKNGGKWVAIVAICLVCALLGGIGGAGIMYGATESRIQALEENVTSLQNNQNVLTTANVPSGSVGNSQSYSGISAASIYDTACKSVVGISSEITGQNFFGMTTSSAVSGSGFIITADGYILTNFHVVEDAYNNKAEITVMTHDGTKYTAALVGYEADNDIAVLKIDGEGLTAAVLGNSDNLQVGDTIYPVGNPLGELEFSMTTGHVSALDRLIATNDSSGYINMFQIDAAVNSGNSGGPVFDCNGQVIGIVTAKYKSSGVEGLGFAIPINDAASIANDLITKGYVSGKASLGVKIDKNYSSLYSKYYKMPIGAYVAEVAKGGCADAAGIQEGDIITRLDDVNIESYEDLRSAIKQHSAGDSAELTFYRAGESNTVTVTFDEAKPETAK